MGTRDHENCELKNFIKISEEMNRYHASMGGRDNRPERLAIIKCLRILWTEIERQKNQIIKQEGV